MFLKISDIWIFSSNIKNKEEIMNDENLEEVDSTNVTLEQQALI